MTNPTQPPTGLIPGMPDPERAINPETGLTQTQAISIETFRTHLEQGLLANGIPRHMWSAITAFVMDGRPLPEFLFSVFTNNLRESVVRADDMNRDRLREYVQLLRGTVPIHCWGTDAAVRSWVKGGGLIGQQVRHNRPAANAPVVGTPAP